MNDIAMVFEQDGRPLTTSRVVAEQFGKRHDHVIRAIEDIISSLATPELGAQGQEFNGRNFALVDYMDAQGKPRPMYLLTRQGFSLLAMGFTGAKTMQFKIAYINAFDRMESLIRGRGKL